MLGFLSSLLFSILLLVPALQLQANDNFSIVFVYIGDELPLYTEAAVKQARLFNEECPIVILANQSAINHFAARVTEQNVTWISLESLTKTQEHREFIRQCRVKGGWKSGFWVYTRERFLYLQDFMVQYRTENVFHLELDNLLYADLSLLLPKFLNYYPGIAATFDTPTRAIAGFIYIRHPYVMTKLAKCFAKHADKKIADMELLFRFRVEQKWNNIHPLPIITREYIQDYPSVSDDFCLNIEHFGALFDAAAIGQYIGGYDQIFGTPTPGVINAHCVFNSSRLTYDWALDENGRKIPYASYGGKSYPMINLHIHSKQLEPYTSYSP